MLLLDLGVFNKTSHKVTTREALIWSILWISLAMLFSGYIYYTDGFDRFIKFQSAYWVEKTLSVDNLFVFILVFNFFKVDSSLHHKVLFWGVLGAILSRAIFIFAGVEIVKLTYININLFDKQLIVNPILLFFGAFLLFAGMKSYYGEDEENQDFSKSLGYKFIKFVFPKISDEYDGDKFFTIKNGIKMATPLLLVVGVIEFTDVLFAVDSIPAIFSIAPQDPFILYTSNIFAILGLRNLYFLLENYIDKFEYLSIGVANILIFIGLKMLIEPIYHIDSIISLIIIFFNLTIPIILKNLNNEYN